MLYKSDINIIKNTAQVGRCFVCDMLLEFISNVAITFSDTLDCCIMNAFAGGVKYISAFAVSG